MHHQSLKSKTLLVSLTLCLTGCSYHFGVDAVRMDGGIAFIKHNQPDFTGCHRSVEVREAAIGSHANDAAPKIVWASTDFRSWNRNNCPNRYPVKYGAKLAPEDSTEANETVPPATLQFGQRYRVLIRHDGGLGSGEFVLKPNGEIENYEAK